MRAVTYDSYAPDNSRLTVGEVPDPKVGPGQVLIEVRAAGINPVDWKIMAGSLDGLLDTVFPVVPGWDVAEQLGREHLLVNERTLPMLRGWREPSDCLMDDDAAAIQAELTRRCSRRRPKAGTA